MYALISTNALTLRCHFLIRDWNFFSNAGLYSVNTLFFFNDNDAVEFISYKIILRLKYRRKPASKDNTPLLLGAFV